MSTYIRRLWFWIVAWFRPGEQGTPLPPKINPENTLLAADIVPPPAPRPLHRPGKFVKPKGELPPKIKREVSTEPKKPRKPRATPAAKQSTEDPEQWGQYYFRDAILDQLDTYFVYLKRMKKGDRDSYNLLRQMGIQIMPGSAIQQFDNWRSEGQIKELSAWWSETRPTFGAVAYGIDKKSENQNISKVLDAPPEFFEKRGYGHEEKLERLPRNRIGGITRGARDITVSEHRKEREGLLWVPKFLYFFKYEKVSKKIEIVKNADIYGMTVYWDRVSGLSRGWHKRHPGGVPQEYVLCIDRDSNAIRILRHEVVESIRVKSRHADKGYISIPHKYWTSCADSQLTWAFGRHEASPENYLIRCFVEAALMYESGAMGSMVRVEVQKENLVATFGVDIKRMSYFFKDRDIVLTPKGKRARIFHIVRPHTRQTKKGEVGVKLTFRGIKKFTWAGYHVSITVPGLHHRNLAEINIAGSRCDEAIGKGEMGMRAFGKLLHDVIEEGKGKWRANAT